MKKLSALFNGEYSAMNGIYWMIYGTVLSFAAVFLQAAGYTNSELGTILAAGNILALVLQPAVAAFADRSKKIGLIGIMVAIGAFIAASLALIALFPGRSALVSIIYAFVLSLIFVIQPLINSFSIFLERWGAHINYGVARGIGSLSYAVLVFFLGSAVEKSSAGILPLVGIALMVPYFGLMALLARQNRKYGHTARFAAGTVTGAGMGEFFRKHKSFVFFLAGTAMMYFAHALFNNFLIEVVKKVGGDSGDMGRLNCFIALFEIPVMFLFDRLCVKFGCARLLRFSIVMYTLKAIAIFLAPGLTALYAVQVLQALSFAVFTPAAVRYVSEIVEPGDAVKGQAFITSMVTLGSIFASLIGGFLYDGIGVGATLLVGAVVSAVGTVAAFPAVKAAKRAVK